jgi:glycosyltransferase involved in cell wall biosynthesis
MNVRFEELSAPQRAGGIEAATRGLVAILERQGVMVDRSSQDTGRNQSGQPDCIHIHGIWSPELAKRWLCWRLRGIPCVVSPHGMLEPWALAHKRWKKQVAWQSYQKQILNRVGLLHATSAREGENLKRLGLTASVAMIPWGIEVLADSGPGSAGYPIRNRRPTSHRPVRTALFVGRIYPVKGLPLLLQAWARVRPVGWKLKIVGPDEAGHRGELEAMVAQAQLGAEIEFTGALSGEALDKAYQEADLFVLPSHTENFGMVVGEALSHGLPVITTHGAPWKLLEEESCGWWVPVSVDGIAAALDDATRRSPEVLTAMGERGRAVVAERFAWERIAGDFLECYRWLLGEGVKPRCVID